GLRKALVPIALLAWPPVAMELRFGNWSLVLAVLTVLVWRCHRAGRPRGAGALLGLAVAIKLFPAVLLGFFVLKRAWRTTGWTIGVAVALTLAPVVVNSDLLLSYLHAGGQVPWGTLASFANYSALGAAARVVTTSHAFGGVPPVVSAPAWTLPLCTLTALVLLLLPAGPVVLLSLLSTLDVRGAVPMRQAVSSAREARVFLSCAAAQMDVR